LQFAPLPVKQPRLKPAAAPHSITSSPWFFYGVAEYCLTHSSSPDSYRVAAAVAAMMASLTAAAMATMVAAIATAIATASLAAAMAAMPT
jgi:hypothetical protein